MIWLLQLINNDSVMNLIFLIQPDIVSQVNEDGVGTTDVFFDLKTVILIVAILVLVIINLTLLRMLKKSNSRVKKLNNKPDYSHFKNIERNTDRTKIEALEKTNKKLKQQLTEIKQIPKTGRVNEVEEIKMEKQEFLEEEGPVVQNFKIEKPEVLFLPSPFEDRKFSTEDVSKERTPFSLYKIKLNPSKVFGDLTFLEDADLSRALNSPDHYLEKACVYVNAFNIESKGIEVVEAGEVKLENDDWFIVQKVKIKFI